MVLNSLNINCLYLYVQTRVFVQLAFFPRKLPPQLIRKIGPRLDSDGIDLVSKFLLYEARKRISARDAMRHPYFDSLGPGVHNLLDGEFYFWVVFLLLLFGPPRVPRRHGSLGKVRPLTVSPKFMYIHIYLRGSFGKKLALTFGFGVKRQLFLH
jgi:hypothetical protein